MKRIAISSGGTAGHINPAISIARELGKKNWEIHYLGNKNSLEQQLIANTPFTFHQLDVQKLYRSFTLTHVKFPLKLLNSIFQSKQILKEIKPDVFLGCGGFVSGPPGFAAHLLHIPIILQEQNSFPGLTTRMLSKYSDMIFLGNRHAEKYFNKAKTLYSGNPIADFLREYPSFVPDTGSKQKTVFLLGGSQGSRVLNNVMLKISDLLLSDGIRIIWQTGRNNYNEILQKLGTREEITLFDYSSKISEYYQKADLIISRAGAITLAELETLHKPAILIPLPSAAENHQLFNALEQTEKGIAEVIEQKDLTPESLLKQVKSMLGKIKVYESNFRETLHASSAERIASHIDLNYGS
jgi:UDP-N-acetylglucosamine--N-acetylmuramyl-(pentapeptide) pyrophosphoryl-undecaprenol N-acetylglucosamine transferase